MIGCVLADVGNQIVYEQGQGLLDKLALEAFQVAMVRSVSLSLLHISQNCLVLL